MDAGTHRAPWAHPPAVLGAFLVALAVVLLGGQPSAAAAWLVHGSGPATTVATVVPQGGTPGATKSLMNVATVTWPATTVLGRPVSGYVVTRYDGTTVSQVTTGSCTGATVNGVARVVTATSCTDERGIDAGTYSYTVRPVFQRWSGPASPRSPAV